MLPKEITDEEEVQRPDEDAIRELTEKTRAALEKKTSSMVSAALPVRAAEKTAPAQQFLELCTSTRCVAGKSKFARLCPPPSSRRVMTMGAPGAYH